MGLLTAADDSGRWISRFPLRVGVAWAWRWLCFKIVVWEINARNDPGLSYSTNNNEPGNCQIALSSAL